MSGVRGTSSDDSWGPDMFSRADFSRGRLNGTDPKNLASPYIWIWIWGLSFSTLGVSAVSAHPPEFHRGKHRTKQPAPASGARTVVNTPASEPDRQLAFFQFEMLADVAGRCPLTIQPQVVRQLLDEYRLATQSPHAPSLEELRALREKLHNELRQRIIRLQATWDRERLVWNGNLPQITVAKGLTRFVIVDIQNATESTLDILTKSGVQEPSRPLTVLPGLSQPFLLEIGSEQSDAELTFTAGEIMRSLTLPVTIVSPAKLRGRILDGDSNEVTAGRVWVEGSDGRLWRSGAFAGNRSFLEKPILELPVMRMAAVPFFYADGSFEFDVPPGKTKVTLERGFEHRLVSETIELAPGEIREVTLTSQRFLDARAQGWVSGDTHIHWVTNAWNVDLPLADLALVQRAEDLRVANNLTLLHRTTTDAFIKPSQAPVGPVALYSNRDYHIEMAEEYRNQNLYGHLCFLNLQWLVLPIGTGPQIAGDDSLDYPLNKTAIIEARGQGGISIEAHGTGANHELPLNAVNGLTDSVDQIDPEDYYRLLDCGFQLPLTNGSDHPARNTGCARAYVQIDGNFDYEKWVDGIRCGRTFTTSGPLLFLTVEDQGPGAVLTPTGRQPLTAKLRAVSRFPLGRVQIVSNGAVMNEVETEEHEITLDCPIPTDESRWVVARCSRKNRWNALWHPDIAHTSAVYVHREGRAVFREAAAAEWIDRMRLHTRDVLTKGLFANISQRTEATEYVDESIRRYERLIEVHRRRVAETDFAALRDRLLMQAGYVSHRGHDSEFVKQVGAATHSGQLRIAAEPLTLLRVQINPESRVKLAVVTSPETVVQHRTHRFLIEIHNQARIQAPLRIQAFDQTNPQVVPASWCSVRVVQNLLSSSLLSGEEHEWKLLELRCSEVGHREIHLEADAGQGTQDLGFRAAADLLVKSVPRKEFRSRLGATSP